MSKKLGFKAVGDRIVILPEKTPEKVGDIIIPDTVNQKSNIGEVISIGAAANKDSEFSVGDRVQYWESSGVPVLVSGVEYIIIREGLINLVLE